jgi:tetratricopeptide (TPR) repeat protein
LSNTPIPTTSGLRDLSNSPSILSTNNFSQHTVYGLSIYARLTKYTIFSLLGLGIIAWTAFEGTHMYVESVELTPESDEDVKIWEWDQEAEKWSGGDTGGTDSALGFKGRHAVRGAWMAQNWGIGPESSVIGSNALSGKGPSGAGGLNIVEGRLEYAQDYLSTALSIAENKQAGGKLHPQTIGRLLTRHAGILERMGSQASWFEARSQLERVWASLPGQGTEAARTALKLGDLNHRLGDAEDALVWWAKTIHLTQTRGDAEGNQNIPTVPESAPTSPLAQRTLISTLVSLSAFYATSGQLREAQAVQESSLDLLQAITPPKSLKLVSAPQALHVLYLLHRSSLLSIHLAEVLFALRSPAPISLQWLTSAAQSSERVALALTGLPSIHPDAPLSKIPHPPSSEAPLLKVFTKSNSLNKPATSLLRDARRTAAEAWNLMGLLNEEAEGTKPEMALQCYERALGWAGVSADRPGGVADPGEGILEAEWKVFWANYVRARDAVRKGMAKP